MTALAIYESDCQLFPNINPMDLVLRIWSVLAVVFSSIIGVFMAETPDDDDFEYEDYLSEDEKEALKDAEDDDDLDYKDGGEVVDDTLDEDDLQDKAGQGSTGDDPDDPGEPDGDNDKGKDSKEDQNDDSGVKPDPKDDEDKKQAEKKQDTPAVPANTGDDRGVTPGEKPLTYEEKVKALEKDLDDGKIEFDDYKKKLRDLDIENTREVTRQEVLKTHAEIKWKEEQSVFFGENPDFTREKANPIVFQAFVSEVNRLAADPSWANESGLKLLAEAKKNVVGAFGLAVKEPEKKPVEPKEKTDGEKAVEKAKKGQSDKNAPKTLKDIPASDKNTDNPFESIDKLDGAAYEKAIANMTPDELEAYENSH